jgi:hypothetical protein
VSGADYDRKVPHKPQSGKNPGWVMEQVGTSHLYEEVARQLIPTHEFPYEMRVLEDEEGNSVPSSWVVLVHQSPLPGDVLITSGYLAAEPDALEYAIMYPTDVDTRTEWAIVYVPRERVYSCTQLADVDDEAVKREAPTA